MEHTEKKHLEFVDLVARMRDAQIKSEKYKCSADRQRYLALSRKVDDKIKEAIKEQQSHQAKIF